MDYSILGSMLGFHYFWRVPNVCTGFRGAFWGDEEGINGGFMGVSGCGLGFVVHRVKGLGWKLQVAVWC